MKSYRETERERQRDSETAAAGGGGEERKRSSFCCFTPQMAAAKSPFRSCVCRDPRTWQSSIASTGTLSQIRLKGEQEGLFLKLFKTGDYSKNLTEEGTKTDGVA